MLELKNQTSNSVDLYIYGDIVSSESHAWDDEDTYPTIIREFLDDANGRDVNIYINSGGGSVFAGMAIASMIKRYEGKTRAYIDGVCGSVATIIFLSADEKYTANNAYFMYHQAWSGIWAYGNASKLMEEVKSVCETLTRISEGILRVYESNIAEGADFETIKNNFNSGKDTWLTGEQICSFFDAQLTDANESVAYCESDFFNKDTAPKEIFNQKPIKRSSKKINIANDYMFEF